ncbi:DNA/RNA non-specific endonuclease [Amycolatopsis sp. cmx-11-32]|uniref:DNA/RNA non-specific endonuclease n=1 Tax=Amycolatopsis sp. cmx-11-32 TaxID=2785796 RepID=UPI0039E4681D
MTRKRPAGRRPSASRWCRGAVVLTVSTALVISGAGLELASAAPAVPAVAAQWQAPAAGAASVPPSAPAVETGDPEEEALLRQLQLDLLADIAALDEDEEVRAAAREALKKAEAGDDAAITTFFERGHQEAKTLAKRRKEEADTRNRGVIQSLAGTGGPAFNAAVDRALQGNAYDRVNFLAFGRDIAAEQDRRTGAYEKEIRDRRRAHVQIAADRGTPEVSAAAKVALAQGDAAIEEYLKTGYLAAAKRDADAREAQLAELERQRKDAEANSELAQRIARVMRARQSLLGAHADGVRSLERTANDMTLAANSSREAARALAADQAGHSYHPELYQRAKDDVARFVRDARTDAQQAQAAAALASAQVDILVQNQMPHGTQWAKVVQGMAAAANAAKQAAETAAHAIDAIAADAAATDAAEKAEAREENARRWRANAQSHADAAERLAQAAREQAAAAAQAAAQARQAKTEAETALQNAKTHAAKVKQARTDAERERDVAAAKRREAEQWRDQATLKRQEAEAKQREAASERDKAKHEAGIAQQKRQEAEAQQRIASAKRVEAQGQEQIAADAAKEARRQEQIAADIDHNAGIEESKAHQAREEAAQLRQSAETTAKKAQALEQLAARAEAASEVLQEDKLKVREAATQARTEANTARDAAQRADGLATQAGQAAASSRAAATESQAAAGRSRAHADRALAAASQARAAAREAEVAAEKSRAAANEAQAAAARANEAASRAEREAAAVHAEALKARASAEEATAAESRAAENARNAANLAQQAAVESEHALTAAHRTQDEANAAAAEAATAATQAGIATRAAVAAGLSGAGIAAPADQAITLVSPFTGNDLDADFVLMVANRAKDVGDTQVRAAQAAAADANAQAERAAEAARNAGLEVKPAFQAAAAAAASAADAARSAAAAQQSAADAAVAAAAARRASAEADAVDVEAQADAKAARAAADQAAADAALAGRAADKAEADARAARKAADDATRAANEAVAAADRAQRDATAAQQAAAQAQRDADAARESANRAADYARDADSAAGNAEKYAKNVEDRAANAEADAKAIQDQLAEMQELLRQEEEARERAEAEQAITDDSEVPALTPEEEELLRAEKGQAGVDEYNRARADANRDLMGLIVDEGGQVILDLIGYTDAKRCFMEGDFISCVMTVINALPILKIASVLRKIPDAVSATVRIVKGIRTFKDVKMASRRIADNVRDLIRQLKGCKKPGAAISAAAPPACETVDREALRKRVEDEHKKQPAVSPQPGQRLSTVARQREVDGCFKTVIPANVSFNYPMENFTWLGKAAKRATGGIVCANKTTDRSGDPAAPVGHPDGVPSTLNGTPVHKGHLVAARLHGSMLVDNIVTQWSKVNLSDVKRVENAVANMLDRYPRQDVSVIYEVHVQYATNTAAMPRWIFIEAMASNGAKCFAKIENIPTGNLVKETCPAFRTA